MEESAINSVKWSISKHDIGECKNHYKFLLVNLDDPTLLLGSFMKNFNKVLAGYPKIKIKAFATASTGSDRILNKCQELGVNFLAKPLTEAKLK